MWKNGFKFDEELLRKTNFSKWFEVDDMNVL